MFRLSKIVHGIQTNHPYVLMFICSPHSSERQRKANRGKEPDEENGGASFRAATAMLSALQPSSLTFKKVDFSQEDDDMDASVSSVARLQQIRLVRRAKLL